MWNKACSSVDVTAVNMDGGFDQVSPVAILVSQATPNSFAHPRASGCLCPFGQHRTPQAERPYDQQLKTSLLCTCT